MQRFLRLQIRFYFPLTPVRFSSVWIKDVKPIYETAKASQAPRCVEELKPSVSKLVSVNYF